MGVEAQIRRKLPNFPTAEEMEELLRPIQLPEASGDWMVAREAALFVAKVAHTSLSEARSALCRRGLRWLRIRAHSFARHEQPHPYIDRVEFFRDRDIKGSLSHFSDTPTPQAWVEMCDFLDAVGSYEPFLAEGGIKVCCWATGDFEGVLEKDFSDVTLRITGLQFDRRGINEMLGLRDEAPDEAPEVPAPAASRGGRPALNHGEAITSIVLSLASMDEGTLAAYTSKALVADLAVAYQRLNETPPSLSNREKLAAGILRAIRSK